MKQRRLYQGAGTWAWAWAFQGTDGGLEIQCLDEIIS